MTNTQRIVVVKLGTSTLVQENGDIDYNRISNVAAEIAALRERDLRTILVTSGAVACGRHRKAKLTGVPKQQRGQLYAAIGQPQLFEFYGRMFERHGMSTAQLLLTRDTFANRIQYFSVRDTIRSLLVNDVVPIINDNDVLHKQEEGFSDNDQLAAYVAGMLNASLCMFLTTPAGVLRDFHDKESVVDLVDSHDAFQSLAQYVSGERQGQGGMKSKVNACRLLFDLGVPSVIASGQSPNVINGTLDGTTRCTRFNPSHPRSLTGVRKWLCTGAIPRGTIYVSEMGSERLVEPSNRGSLLATGVVKVSGDFSANDVVCLCTEDGSLLGYGISRLSFDDLKGADREPRTVVVHADFFYGTAFGLF